MTVTCRLTGWKAIFKGLDDIEKRKSTTFDKGILTDVWIEEASETVETVLQQMKVRLRGMWRGMPVEKQITISFNPVSIMSWLHKLVEDLLKTSPGSVLHTTYKDNAFLTPDDIATIESFEHTDEYYWTVYGLGEWGVLGKTIFDAAKVAGRINVLRDRKPLRIGCFAYEEFGGQIVPESIKWIDDERTGFIKIFEEPQYGHPYVAGGDTAGEGSDFFTGYVLNNHTGRQVAALRHQMDEDLYADQMVCLGYYFNDALLAPEINFSTYPCKRIAQRGYPNIYLRQKQDDITGEFELKHGFKTTKLTRPIIIAGLVQIVRENVGAFWDLDLLGEMLTFVRSEKDGKYGRPEAQDGAHDDCVMAAAIAYYCREQYRTTVLEDAPVRRKKLKDKLIPQNQIWM
jgi:phage terminase large subunit